MSEVFLIQFIMSDLEMIDRLGLALQGVLDPCSKNCVSSFFYLIHRRVPYDIHHDFLQTSIIHCEVKILMKRISNRSLMLLLYYYFADKSEGL